jgi:hypothetical protein
MVKGICRVPARPVLRSQIFDEEVADCEDNALNFP